MRYPTAADAIAAAKRSMKRGSQFPRYIRYANGAWTFCNMRAVEFETHYLVRPDGATLLRLGWRGQNWKFAAPSQAIN